MEIKDGFNEIAQKYDNQRKLSLPCFDDFYNLPLEVLDYNGISPEILDVGGGTGLFSSFILTKYPQAKITIIDLADKMIDVAKERFQSHSDFQYIVADYTKCQYTQKYDIIISALSIHHLSHDDKRIFYQKCYYLLNDGGCFINADLMLSPSKHIEEVNQSIFHNYRRTSGLSEDVLKATGELMKYDNPAALYDQLQWLVESKFRYVDCVYKYHQFCVLYAQK
ncbi:MAG: class I SAM-dependent methyltransferase [Oscillospiraceae bacterium]|nr:class I SAM-dependent methyltransferase [Oscillospiraceae bacterium]